MKVLAAPLLALALPLAACCQQPPLVRAAALLDKGDAIGKQGGHERALIAYKQAFELILPEIRRRPFRRTVAPRILRRPALKAYLEREFAREMSARDALFLDRAVKLLGLAPDDMDVPQMLLRLLTDEVAGFYNAATKQLFLVHDAVPEKPGNDKNSPSPLFDPDELRGTLAHEMAHALADQHFDLAAFDELFEDNEDAALAASALVEGEAMLVMVAELSRARADAGQLVLQTSPEYVDKLFGDMDLAASSEASRAAPEFFRKSLVFPYHRGTMFAAHLANRSGWAGIDHALRFPPTSTEQILHPRKYFSADHRDDPTALTLPRFDDLLPGWSRLGDDTLGEYQLRLTLQSQPDAERAAGGWDGDRYVVVQRPASDRGGTPPEDAALLWVTTWDSQRDAEEFRDCLTRAAIARLKLKDGETPVVSGVGRLSGGQRLKGGRRPFGTLLQDADVAVVEGIDDDKAALLLQRLHRSGHGDWNYRLPPVEHP